MPLYPYKCGTCDYEGEVLVPTGEKPAKCDACGAEDITRLWHGQTFAARTGSRTGRSDLEQTVMVPTGIVARIEIDHGCGNPHTFDAALYTEVKKKDIH